MNVSTIYGFAFLCVPKTGSTSIKKAILEHSTIHYGWKHSLKHMSARTFSSHILPFHQQLFPEVNLELSCVMRDPVSWVHSWYKFRKRPELLRGAAHKRAMYTGNVSYEEFVRDLLNPISKNQFASIASQSKYILLEDGSVGVDKIFKLENGLDLVGSYFSEKIGQRINIPQLNKSSSNEETISSELQEMLIEHFSEDQKLYDSLR